MYHPTPTTAKTVPDQNHPVVYQLPCWGSSLEKKVAWVAKLYYKSGRTTAEVLGANIKQVSAKPNYSRDTTIATYSLRHIHS